MRYIGSKKYIAIPFFRNGTPLFGVSISYSTHVRHALMTLLGVSASLWSAVARHRFGSLDLWIESGRRLSKHPKRCRATALHSPGEERNARTLLLRLGLS